jgi:hypothetical protein
MTHDDIFRMAQEAGLRISYTEVSPWFIRFAALVAAAEREACAKACDQLSWKLNDDITKAAFTMAADTIRARGAE